MSTRNPLINQVKLLKWAWKNFSKPIYYPRNDALQSPAQDL